MDGNCSTKGAPTACPALAGGPQLPFGGPPRPSLGTLTVSELENLLEMWKLMRFSPAMM